MRYLIFILIFLVSICQSQNFITISTKSDGQTLTAAEFNQILNALKDSTKAIKTTHIYTGTLRLGATNYTAIMIPAAFDDSVANYLTDAHIPNSITASNYLLLVNADDSSDARITYQLTQARTISGNWVSTAYPWSDNELADNLTASNYLLLTAFDDSLLSNTSDEIIADFIGTMVTGNTETNVTVTYQDADNTLDFVVSTGGDMVAANFDDSLASITSDEIIQDLIGLMTTGNTESGITVAYQDADGTIDFTVTGATDDSSWHGIQTNSLSDKSGGKITVNDTLHITKPITGISSINLSKISNFQAGGVALKDTFDLLYQPLDAQLSDIADGTLTGDFVNTAYPWSVNEGGSGAATFTDGGVMIGNGTSALQVTAVLTNGQLLIGDGTTDPTVGTLTGGSSVTVTNGAGTITLSAPDTLTQSWFVKDTTIVGVLPGWKVPYGITILTVSSYVDANTCTFNLEERDAATPNTAGTDVLSSDQVADNNEQTTSTINNSVIDKTDWLIPTISATGDVSVFAITIWYRKN